MFIELLLYAWYCARPLRWIATIKDTVIALKVITLYWIVNNEIYHVIHTKGVQWKLVCDIGHYNNKNTSFQDSRD